MIIIGPTPEVCIYTARAGYIDAVDVTFETNIPWVRHGRVITILIFDSRVIVRCHPCPLEYMQQSGAMGAFLAQGWIGIGVAICAIYHAG